MGTAIEVQHLRKAYGSNQAVRDVSFRVEEGEVLGVLGPNGAGKTTTVECVVGLRTRDGGTVRVLGHDPADRDAITRLVGVQPQEVALPERLKVGEAMDLWASFYDEPWDTGDLLESVELGDRTGSYVGKLSGGQRQRLSVAIALVGDPRVAVLDELTTGLDPAARRRIWSLVDRLRDRGTTVLLVSHLMPEVERLCDRVVVIDRGEVVASGAPRDLAGGTQRLRFKASRDVRPILGAVPEVTRVEQHGDAVTVEGGGEVVTAVIAALAAHDLTARHLRVDQSSLDDAFVALTHEEALS